MAQSPRGLIKSATNGADLYGFTAQFQKRLDALGEISVDEFLERYERPEQYVDSLSYDPVSDEFSAKPGPRLFVNRTVATTGSQFFFWLE